MRVKGDWSEFILRTHRRVKTRLKALNYEYLILRIVKRGREAVVYMAVDRWEPPSYRIDIYRNTTTQAIHTTTAEISDMRERLFFLQDLIEHISEQDLVDADEVLDYLYIAEYNPVRDTAKWKRIG